MELAFLDSGVRPPGTESNKVLYFDLGREEQNLSPNVTVSRHGAMFELLQFPLLYEKGIGGYYRGLGPSVTRAAVVTGCGIASYDQSKQVVIAMLGTAEGYTAQVLAALVSGFVSAAVSTPPTLCLQPKTAPQCPPCQ
jgi:hypothetical protein